MNTGQRSLRVPSLTNSRFAEGGIAWDFLHDAATQLREGHPIACLDLSGTVHLKPYVIALMAALCRHRRADDFEVKWPTNAQAREHLARLRLHTVLNIEAPEAQERETNIPLRILSKPESGFSWEVVELLEREFPDELPPGVKPTMADHIDEIIQNALGHADSQIGCVVCGQSFPRTGTVEAAIVDLGITIHGHLRKKYANIKTDSDAVEMATQSSITGTPQGAANALGDPNSGAGLYELRTYMEQGGGELAILSGSSVVAFQRDRDPVKHALQGHRFRGTLVNMRFVTRPVEPPGPPRVYF